MFPLAVYRVPRVSIDRTTVPVACPIAISSTFLFNQEKPRSKCRAFHAGLRLIKGLHVH
jgi:hypothetical protein